MSSAYSCGKFKAFSSSPPNSQKRLSREEEAAVEEGSILAALRLGGAAGAGFACQSSHTTRGTMCPAPVPVIHPVSCDHTMCSLFWQEEISFRGVAPGLSPALGPLP